MAKIPKQRRAKNPDNAPNVGKYYLTNATLLPEVIRSKELGQITPKLAGMLKLLTERYSCHPNFIGYSFREDMCGEALVNLSRNALLFNPEKSSNPFAFYTTAIYHSFLQYLNTEKRHRNIRDALLIEIGENPSFNYMEESKQHTGEDASEISEGLADLSKNIEEAKARRVKQEADDVQGLKEVDELQDSLIAAYDQNDIDSIEEIQEKLRTHKYNK